MTEPILPENLMVEHEDYEIKLNFYDRDFHEQTLQRIKDGDIRVNISATALVFQTIVRVLTQLNH